VSRLCRIGLHDYEFVQSVNIVLPRRGPFDPRDDAQRTVERLEYVCVRCGKKQLKEPYSLALEMIY
jgi:ABC-type transporter lipoprotein component MlaA